MERFSKHQLCELVSCLSKNHVSAAEQLLNIRNSLRMMELEKAKEGSKEGKEESDLYTAGDFQP